MQSCSFSVNKFRSAQVLDISRRITKNSSLGLNLQLYPKCSLLRNISGVRCAMSIKTKSRRCCSVLFFNRQKVRISSLVQGTFKRTEQGPHVCASGNSSNS